MGNTIINEESKPIRRTSYYAYSIASVLFLIGVVAFLYFIDDYKKSRVEGEYSNYFDKDDDTASLAGMIASTTGLLWSFAGVILFAFNIRQTQHEIELQIEEMKDQGETFQEQMLAIKAQSELLKAQAEAVQNQSTQYTIQTNALLLQQKENSLNNILNNYFNLLQSFEEGERGTRITGYLVLNKMYREISSVFEKYLENFDSMSFTGRSIYYQYTPLFNGSYSSYIFALIDNFIFHHQFIRTNFQEPDLYFRRLYNCYSDAEKYFIGLFIINANGNESYTNPFDFTSFVKRQGNYYDFRRHYLPIVDMEFLFPAELLLRKEQLFALDGNYIAYDETLRPASNQTFIEFEIVENRNNEGISVKNVDIEFKYQMDGKSQEKLKSKIFENKIFTENKLKVSIRPFLREGLKYFEENDSSSSFKKLNIAINIKIKLELSNNRDYEILFERKLEINYNFNQNDCYRIYTRNDY